MSFSGKTSFMWLAERLRSLATLWVLALSTSLLAQSNGPVKLPIADELEQVTWGNGVFVAVGENGTILVSTNASDWFLARQVPGTNLFAVHYADSQFVAAGGFYFYGTVLTSRDGQTWVEQELGDSDPFFGVAYGGGTWVIVGESAILTSTNGTTWDRSSTQVDGLWSVAYGAGVFIAVGRNGLILRSPDGQVWTKQDAGTNDWLLTVNFLDGQFVAAGQAGVVYTSPDGVVWTPHLTPERWIPGLTGLTDANSLFVAIGFNGSILTSSDVSHWTPQVSGVDSSLRGIAFGNGSLVAVGGGVGGFSGFSTLLTSTDAVHWRILAGKVLTVGIQTIASNVPTGFPATFTALVDPSEVTSSRWDFADGTILTNVTQASHAWTTAGDYAVVFTAYNPNHPDGVSATQTVQVLANMPPIVATQPQDQTNAAGLTAVFSALPIGSALLSFQWLKEGVPVVDHGNISGTFTPTLSLSNILKADEAGYSLAVSNSYGAVTSLVAHLSVLDPAIVQQPDSPLLDPGQSLTLSALVAGTAPLQYQWWKDGLTLTGAVEASLTLTNVQAIDAGRYWLVVTNQFGNITSTVAQVAVNLATLDPFFNASADNAVYTIALQSDGKILLGGDFESLGGELHSRLGRLNADGTVDNTFTPFLEGQLYFNGDFLGQRLEINSIALQEDGKILVGGEFITVNGQPCTNIARLNSDGSLDANFNPAAVGDTNGDCFICYISALALQPDGRIVLGGQFQDVGGAPRSNIARLNADGTVDATFNPAADGPVDSLVVQTDGKILLGGSFSTIGGNPRANLARLNADGTLDPGFNPSTDGSVRTLALQADLRILVGGSFFMLGGQPRALVGRLNTDGTVDGQFNPTVTDDWGYSVESLALQTDGKVLLGGNFYSLSDQERDGIGRLNSDGSLDTTFEPGAVDYFGYPYATVLALAIQPDGKVLVGGHFDTLDEQNPSALGQLSNLGRLNSTGLATHSLALDGSNVTWLRGGSSPEVWHAIFESSTNTSDWTLLGEGSRIAGGWQLGGIAAPGGAWIRARGFVSASGTAEWIAEDFYGRAGFISYQPASRTNNAGTTAEFMVLAGGSEPLGFLWLKNGIPLRNEANINGALTPSLLVSDVLKADQGAYSVVVTNAYGSITSLVASLTVIEPLITAQPNSQFGNVDEEASLAVVAAGTAPFSYQWWKESAPLAGETNSTLVISDLQLRDDANYYVVVSNSYGSVTSLVASITVNVVTVDDRFNLSTQNPAMARAISLEPDGKILLGGDFNILDGQEREHLGRINVDGSLDGGFNPVIGPYAWNYVSTLAVEDDGRILLGGQFGTVGGQSRTALARVEHSGALDGAFTPSLGDYVFLNTLAVQNDHKILVGGEFTAGGARTNLTRLNRDGSVDPGFNAASDGDIFALALQPDGKILVGGSFSVLQGKPLARLARLNMNSTLDNTFNPGGADDIVSALLVQPDGKILVGGTFTTIGGQPCNALARLNPDGTVDSNFKQGAGTNYTWWTRPSVLSLALQTDGKILVAGNFSDFAGHPRNGIVRLDSDGSVELGFNPFAYQSISSIVLQSDGRLLLAHGLGVARLNNTEPAFQNLTFDGSTLTWMRGGSSAEVWRTTFEALTAPMTWVFLGAGQRIAGGWQLTNASLPTPAMSIRARGYVPSGGKGESIVETNLLLLPQILTGDGAFGLRSNQFGFNISGPAGHLVFVETSTNLLEWLTIQTNTFGNAPLYFSDPDWLRSPHQFYRARLQ